MSAVKLDGQPEVEDGPVAVGKFQYSVNFALSGIIDSYLLNIYVKRSVVFPRQKVKCTFHVPEYTPAYRVI